MSGVIRASGNEVVVEQLEKMLKLANEGKMSYCAIAMLAHGVPVQYVVQHFGDTWLQPHMAGVLKELAADVDKHVAQRTLPEPTEPADYVTYNVPAGSLSYDFLIWLINAEMTRVREKGMAPLKVKFWHGHDHNPQLDEQRARMYFNVVKPSLKLIGAVETKQMGGRFEPVYTPKPFLEYFKKGETIPKFRAPDNERKQMLGFADCVTITLREATHWPHRNSNLEEWLAFASYLQKRGHRVVFVRDFEKATETLDPFEISPDASRDILIRTALYGVAKANLFVSNGPATLAVFGDRPWLQFVQLEADGHTYYANTPAFWLKFHGLKVGEQYPWSTKQQRLVWNKKDNFENLVEEWESLFS